MLPWRRPEPSPEEEGVLWGHLARVGARRRPAQPSFELVYSLSVCQLFRLSRFVPDFDVSGKTAEPKMAFNFAHLLSAACGGAPRRLGRLRRPWARCARLFCFLVEHEKIATFLRKPSLLIGLEVSRLDILRPRWVARIGVTRSTEACFLTADRQCTELPLLRLPRLVPEVARV